MSVFNQSRSRIIRLLFIGAFAVIIGQLFYLQVVSGKFRQLAMDNAVFPKIIYPERGIIYDRKGQAILNNTNIYDLLVVPAEVKNIDTLEFCRLMNVDTAEFKKRLLEARLKNTAVRPTVFDDLLTPEMSARFEENGWKFPGFTLVERPVRTYPFNAGAHLLGYISEADPRDIERSENFYRMGDYIGKSGLEAYYESVLMGQRGVQYWIKDNKNRLVQRYDNGAFDTAATAGRGLKTYIDIELQQLAEKLMTNKVGGLVAIDPKTGGILAMVSGPNFNPNDLSGSYKSKNYSRMALDVTGPMLNRAISGLYEPGSTFKPIGGLVALDEELITPAFGYPCFGRYTGCGSGKPACTHSGGGHSANLRAAIAYSCNSYFTHLYRLAVDNPKYGSVTQGYLVWSDYMHKFGLGTRLGVDLPNENRGNVGDTATYNRENAGYWNSCTNLTLGIGQDKLQTTPLQMANAMCIIANRGSYYIPHFVEKIEDETEADTALVNKYRVKHNVLTHITDTAFNAIIEGMADVVKFGTARIAEIPGIEVCAKTGTAETYTILDKHRIKLPNNSMFVCFAPKDNPRIAIAVCVQNAGFGSTWGGPIARILIEKYLNDTIQEKSVKDLERISKANLMPAHYQRLQFIADSTRAEEWYKMTKDSSYLKKYLGMHTPKPKPVEGQPPVPTKQKRLLMIADLPAKKTNKNPVAG